jgi:predicted transcriptional regulator
LKRRANIIIYMEILALLREEARGPTRLAQACNLSFDRLIAFIKLLEAKNLVRSDLQDGHELYYITTDGNQLYQDWMKVWEKLSV